MPRGSRPRKAPTGHKSTEMTTSHHTYVAQRKAELPTDPGAQPAALACVLKVENTLVVCMLPHCGQGGCTPDCGLRSDAQTFSYILHTYTQKLAYSLPLCILVLRSASLPDECTHR